MADYRSRSYADGRMRMELYGGGGPPAEDPAALPHTMRGMRSYSTSHAYSGPAGYPPREIVEFKKGKSTSASSSKSKTVWSINDPELQRRKRVVGYKVYSVEGKVKGSLRKSFRWLKERCTRVVYGWW